MTFHAHDHEGGPTGTTVSAGDPPQTLAALTEWIRQEQASLWSELGDAIRSSVNGAWSIRASNAALRILSAARLVGPTPLEDVPWCLTAGDVYRVLLVDIGGLAPELPDDAEWRRLDALMAKHGDSRESALLEYAETRAAMTHPREMHFIRDGVE